MKYIVVSGGVISGIGKGVIASSTGLLMKTQGLKICSIKIDPYMNLDAGTMSPLEHGECFVLNDGGETDLDLGNYERYVNIELSKDHNITTGKIYMNVIERERKGEYLGKTVQIVPHLTNAIQDWIERVSKIPVDSSGEEPDLCIIELGGTVGDIESAPFIEALRQFQFRVGKENFALIHVSLVPVIHGEQKTKPTQAAIKDLRSLGLTPDLIAVRCQEKLDVSTIDKIAMFCHVGVDRVINVYDVNSTYHVPLLLKEQGLIDTLNRILEIDTTTISESFKGYGSNLFTNWNQLCSNIDSSDKTVQIALVGKYTNLHDSYLSVIKALEHSCMKLSKKLQINWIESTDLENCPNKDNEKWEIVKQSDGILVPGGFGSRGIEGMILAANYARLNKVPYLGICLGLQVATIEFCRNVLEIENGSSCEFEQDMSPEDPRAIVVYMPEIDQENLGGTMRLGLRTTNFSKEFAGSKIQKIYGGFDSVEERHRHRYEVNPELIPKLEPKGLKFVGKDETLIRCEILELDDHPYYVATQYHPEYKSKVLKPSPPFLGLVAAASGELNSEWLNKCVKEANEISSEKVMF
ncbi:CTP synthase [Hanseniaspora valbyensis NRRL Y-1626]|uniref:CTP synthase n=1 Tax=Hanseniaspora valbyensis NRRL Y-1626 TaxID=766949 RepID=A0A1B7TFU5_9ASCO|nr:CTP synthase [Hanseniaspora valbyensis NRRL Y-1626]